jgi:hypothetical protein
MAMPPGLQASLGRVSRSQFRYEAIIVEGR